MAITLNGERCKTLRLMAPKTGPWLADVELEGTPVAPSGAVELVAGTSTLVGTVAPEASSRYLTRVKVRVIAGAAGWRKILPARAYHNDVATGVSAKSVLDSTAAACGETLTGAYPAGQLGADFARVVGPASRTIGRIAPAWWVGYDGLTRMVARDASAPTAPIELKDFDPHSRVADLEIAELEDIAIGMVISDSRLAAPATIEAFEAVWDKTFKVAAWLV